MKSRWNVLGLGLGACACMAAHAADGTVTVFGTVDLYLAQATSGPTRVYKEEDGGQAASKIGFRGTEDLGGGSSAHFYLEGGFAPDTGAGTIPGPGIAFTRQSFVGITTPWGSVNLGRQYTPMFSMLLKASPFGVNAVFSSLNLVAATDAQPGAIAFAARGSNMVRYRTPTGRDWFVDLGAAMGEGTLPKVLSAAAGYEKGPLFVAYGFQSASAPVTHAKTTYQGVSGTWNFEIVKVGAQYQHVSTDSIATPGAKLWTASLAVPVGNSQVVLEATTRRVANSARSQLAATLGYDYFLSKRTVLYARVLFLDNRRNASVSLAQVPVIADSGNGVRVTAVGIRHNF